MNKAELARAVGVSPTSVSAYEAGRKAPSAQTLGALSRELGFPEAFFHREGTRIPTLECASFRSLARLSARDRDAALAMGAIGQELSDWLDDHFSLPGVQVPDLRGASPEEAARALRVEWELGSQPIRHATKLMESRGAHVFSLAERSDAVDAFSLWSGAGRPLIFLNTLKSAERSRWDCCHELGHLLLHLRWGKDKSTREAEDEANEFASVFLMPVEDVIGRIPRNPTLGKIVELKSRWGVSVMALLRRARRLNQLDQRQYERLVKQAARRGWRKSEPEGMRRETSVLLGKILQLMREKGRSPNEIADALCVHPSDLNQLMLGLAIVPLPGGGESRAFGGPTPPPPHEPQLTLIECDA